MTKQRYFSLILILGLLTALGPFSIDMYLPGFRDIADNLHTTVARVSLSLSSYFIGISLGQLLYGPLLDRHGRKKPLYAGLLLYILASAACLRVTSINMLIVLRFVQAVGSCGAAVGSMAMVRDLFGVKESAKVFSLLLLVVGASPMIAPTAGGYVISLFGWRAVFAILLIMAILITLLTTFFLPESAQADPSFSLRPGPITRNFVGVLKVRAFLTYALAGSLSFSGLLSYVSGSPNVFMDIYHVDKKVYGWIFAGLSVGFIGFSQFNTLLLKRYSSRQIIRIAMIAQVLVIGVFLGGNMAGWFGLYGTITFIFLFLVCLGFIYPNTAALSLAPFSRNAGSASAIMGAMQIGIGALASVGVSVFSNGTATPMIASMAITSALALLILLTWGRGVEEPAIRDAAVVAGIH
jgi:MFS transporter, DHA1 family, multidrug resistance protein